MTKLKAVHRITGALIMIVLMYLSVTGLMMQGIDLSEIIRGGQPVDPDLAGAAPANGAPLFSLPPIRRRKRCPQV